MKLLVGVGILFLALQVFAEEPNSEDTPEVAKRGFPAYVSVGCFNDRRRRALPVYLGYRRGDIKWCARQAKARGYKVFAVQYFGQCFSGPTAQATYARYGASKRCRNGIGTAWTNFVYRFVPKAVGPKPYRHIGCWRDRPRRAIAYIGRVFGAPRVRVKKCANMASKRGFKVFAIQAATWCFSGPRAHLRYKVYGPARNCAHGTGGGWANDVYRFKRLPYVSVGCFKDKHRRALPVYLGYRRGDIQWCAKQAKARGYKVFAVQYFGQCFSGPTAQATYARYGASKRCRNGIGTAWTNYVYRITPKPKRRKFRKINRRPVCFAAKGNRPGILRYYGPSRIVNGLLLVYRSGRVTCHYRDQRRWSRWGCGGRDLMVVVTDQYNYLIYPRREYIRNHAGLWYRLPGKHSKHSKSLFFSNVATPFHLTTAMRLKVWFGEDLKNWKEADNRGHVCVDVYAWFA